MICERVVPVSKLSIALAAASMLSFAAFCASGAQFSVEDESFVVDASQTNLAEIKAGHLALQKGELPNIKRLGQVLVTDHAKSQDQLRQIAQRQGFSLRKLPVRSRNRWQTSFRS
jgi:putative membrane protein